MKTFLQDAADAGARFVVGARAERILTDDGRASGVQATVTHEDGSTTALTVEAPTVVVAAGAIESPALLLRSGIGGPAAGKHLRLHPAALVGGVYEQPIEGWIGQIQSALSDEFKRCEGEHGFLIEATTVAPAIVAMSLPWQDGLAHKQTLGKLSRIAPFISVARDHGEGEVALDAHGRALTRWGFGDQVDARLFRRAMVELARLHRAAGATEIITFYQRPSPRLERGRGLRRVPGGDRGGVAGRQRRRRLHRAPDGLVPDGLRPGGLGGGRQRPAARHRRRLDRGRLGLPDGAGRQPDDLDHVARAPHRREHRDGYSISASVKPS